MRVNCIRWLGYVIVAGGILASIAVAIAAGFWIRDQIADPTKLNELIGKITVAVLAFLGSKVFRQAKPGGEG